MSGRCPAATWRPITYDTGAAMSAHLGVVLHVNQGEGDPYNYVNNPANDVNAHFQVPKLGKPFQYVDGARISWCQRDGNPTYLSMETEGYGVTVPGHPAAPLNDNQLDGCAAIMAWAHTTYGIPLQLAERPGDRGLGWHGMGAAAGVDWGHSQCPGEIRKAQRGEILQRAQAILNPKADDMTEDEVAGMIQNALHAVLTGNDRGRWTHKDHPQLVQGPNNGIHDRITRCEDKLGLYGGGASK